MITAKEIRDMLVSAKRVAIFGHVRPDLDCFGAMFGAKFLCESLGTKCDMFANVPENSFLLNIFPKRFLKQKFDKNKYDLILVVDCNTLSRIDESFRSEVTGKNLLFIDHHAQNIVEENAEFYFFPEKCSASIMIYELIDKYKIPLDATTATYIFAGLVVDTGRFLHTNTDESAFICASKLTKVGADIQKVYDVTYRSLTVNQVRLRNFIFENLKSNGNVCYITVSEKDLKKLKSSAEDLKIFIDDVNKIKDFDVVMFAYEVTHGEYKVSLRSKNGVVVSSIATKYGGGGHKMAAGFSLVGNKKSVAKKLKVICEEFYA